MEKLRHRVGTSYVRIGSLVSYLILPQDAMRGRTVHGPAYLDTGSSDHGRTTAVCSVSVSIAMSGTSGTRRAAPKTRTGLACPGFARLLSGLIDRRRYENKLPLLG